MQTLPARPAQRAPSTKGADRRPQPSALARYLLGDGEALPDIATLRGFGLSGHAFARLPGHPERHTLRADFRYASARHLTTRATLAPLLRAWQEAGVDALVFKGFQLAEFVYEAPGLRIYADVDILVREAEAARACALACAAGWKVSWRASAGDDLRATHGSEYLGHEAAHLEHPTADVSVDLHRRVVHNNHNRRPAPAAATFITNAVLDSAVASHVDGATVLMPQPVDALIVGLALNRCWGSDDWRIKPRDYADFEALSARYELTNGAIMARASELGVRRTVETYLRRCQPQHHRLVLSEPSWWARRWWNLRATPERGQRDLERLPHELVDAIRDALALWRTLPAVQRARRRLPQGRWAEAHHPPAGPGIGPRHWRRLRLGIQRSLRLLKVAEAQREAVAALAAHELLGHHGVEVRLEPSASGEPQLIYRGEPLAVTASGRAPA